MTMITLASAACVCHSHNPLFPRITLHTSHRQVPDQVRAAAHRGVSVPGEPDRGVGKLPARYVCTVVCVYKCLCLYTCTKCLCFCGQCVLFWRHQTTGRARIRLYTSVHFNMMHYISHVYHKIYSFPPPTGNTEAFPVRNATGFHRLWSALSFIFCIVDGAGETATTELVSVVCLFPWCSVFCSVLWVWCGFV